MNSRKSVFHFRTIKFLSKLVFLQNQSCEEIHYYPREVLLDNALGLGFLILRYTFSGEMQSRSREGVSYLQEKIHKILEIGQQLNNRKKVWTIFSVFQKCSKIYWIYFSNKISDV